VFLLPLVQVVWVNAHPLFVFGPLLVGLLLTVTAAGLAPGRAGSADRARSLVEVRTLAGVLVATVVACLVNPYGIQGALHPLLLFSEVRGSVFRDTISELKSPFAFGATYTAVVWYEALIGLCVVSAAVNLRRLDPFWTLFCISQLYLSTLSIRNLPLFCLAAVPFIVSNLDRSVWLEGLGRRRWFVGVRRAVALGVVALCAFYAWRMVTDRISVSQNDSNQFGLGIASHRFPVDSVDFILQHPTEGRVYATLLESSYLVSRDVEVFADPRLEVYGEALFSRYLAAEHDIRTALVDLRSGLAAFLHTAPEWKLVHFDSVAAVWVTREGPGRAIETAADYAAILDVLREDLPRPPRYDDVGLLDRVTIPKPYLALADFLLAAGRTEEAATWLSDARAAGPFMPGLAARQARVATLSRNWSDVARFTREALEDAPRDARLMIGLGEALFRLNEYDEARSWLTKSLEGQPDRALTWLTLGRIYLARQEHAEAQRCFRRGVQLSPQEAIYHSSLARALALVGRNQEAIAGLEHALSLDPQNVTILRDLADLYREEGNTAAARAYVNRGLQIDPLNRELLQLDASLSSR
jgi:tetratricopeptide (TPR) repeat protein